MAITRKPLPDPMAPAQHTEENPPTQLRRQDSWEVYSDEEEDEPSVSASQPTQPAVVTAPGEPNYIPYAPPTSTPTNESRIQADQTGTPGQVPDALRPGGGRAQTNPFLRRKLPQDASIAPTEALSKLSTADSNKPNPNPWSSVQRSGTVESSNYGTPPTTTTSETNPWNTNPPPRTYSPVSDPSLLPDSQQSIPVSSQPVPAPPPIPPPAQPNPWASSPRPVDQETAGPTPRGLPAETNPWTDSGSSAPLAPPVQPPPVPQATPAVPAYDAPAATDHVPSKDDSEGAPFIVLPMDSGPPLPSVPTQEHERPVDSQTQSPIPQNPSEKRQSPAPMSVASGNDSTWVDASQEKDEKTTPPIIASATGPASGDTVDHDAWAGLDALDQPDKGKTKAVNSQIEDWKLVDVGESSAEAEVATAPSGSGEGQQATASQPTTGDDGRWVSPRPPIDAKTETYQVKNITWHDATVSQNPRESPILVQNANGPCPLVALVNALSLTTPPDVSDGSLVGVLKSREQISLNLLLDAVFEELMSPRRTDEDAILPDIGDLYAFLMSLHTGLNVNPRFIPSQGIREAYGRTSLTHLDASERANLIPGTFENTHEMSLYATFRIPLIHGWLPPSDDPVYEALERQAQSYEDAQNLLFREEELESKLLTTEDGLTPEEQELYQDIITIKSFFESSATQLTAWGIQVISKAIRPGSFAILFRNDHFSTLYCHPQTKDLVTLVTDEGYRTHKEVVWESLVDINGKRTQHLSGDFGVVGPGQSDTSGGYPDEQSGEWTTVEGRRGRSQQQDQQPLDEEAPTDPREQEDRDLALALQLQEEEDQRHREDEARREREHRLSSQYIEQQGRQQYGNVSSGSRVSSGSNSIAPARHSSNALNVPGAGGPHSSRPGTTPARPPGPSQQIRPMVPPRRSNIPPANRPANSGADAPPPYEQAAHDQPFVPPLGHPSHATSSTDVSHVSTSTSTSNANPGLPPRPGQVTRPPGPQRPTGTYHTRERERDCIVM